MTLRELIQASIDIAIAGTDPDRNPLAKQTLEAESLLDTALQELAREVRGIPSLRARMVKEFSVTLTSGIGTIPETLLIEFLGEGIVRDGDAGANNGYGN